MPLPLQTAIDAFLAHVRTMRDAENKRREAPGVSRYFLDVTLEPGKAFARVVVNNGCSHSAYAFIALTDSTSKKMGEVKAGQVFKPDGWKGPAKHARADVFNPDTWKAAGLYGMAYL